MDHLFLLNAVAGIHKSLFMTITRALCVTWWQRWDLISRQASLRLSISAWILSFFLATIISKLQFLQLGISFISNRAVNQHQQLGTVCVRVPGIKGRGMTSVPYINVLKLRCLVLTSLPWCNGSIAVSRAAGPGSIPGGRITCFYYRHP